MRDDIKCRPPWDWTVDDVPQALSFLNEPPLPDDVGVCAAPAALASCLHSAGPAGDGGLACAADAWRVVRGQPPTCRSRTIC